MVIYFYKKPKQFSRKPKEKTNDNIKQWQQQQQQKKGCVAVSKTCVIAWFLD